MARFKITSSKQFNKPSSAVPKDVRSFMENGFLAIEFTVEDTETGQKIKVGPLPFTDDKPEHKRNVEKLALESAAKVVKA
jgi:hypothetical protein